EMENLKNQKAIKAAQDAVNLEREIEAKARDLAEANQKREDLVESPLPLTPVEVNQAPNKDASNEERFQEIFNRLDRLETFARKQTDPDLIRTSSFTRPETNQNQPNAIMEPKFKPVDTTPMTEEEHEAAMGTIKIPGSENWLAPYQQPPSKQAR